MTDKASVAKLRWKLLSQSLLKAHQGNIQITNAARRNNEIPNVSVRRFENFGLFSTEQSSQKDLSKLVSWLLYNITIDGSKVKLKLCVYTSVQCQDLQGFNNTGNICIWPSEEVMAYYLISNISHWLHSKPMKVCELGGGMTCFAGFVISAILNHYSSKDRPHEIILSDGNKRSCDNIRRIIAENREIFDPNVVSIVAKQIIWDQTNDSLELYKQSIDLIICSDCFFFVEAHDNLISTINYLLKPQIGRVICFAPLRKDTFNIFKEKAQKHFEIEVNKDYISIISELNNNLTSCNESYSQDLHYPIQIVLKSK